LRHGAGLQLQLLGAAKHFRHADGGTRELMRDLGGIDGDLMKAQQKRQALKACIPLSGSHSKPTTPGRSCNSYTLVLEEHKFELWQDFHQARVSIARLGDILNATPEPSFDPARAALPPIRGEVTFDHVSFRYRPDGPLALHDVALKVPAGQVVGIVGPSGSGKSTLTKLAQRLYVPESGRILIDGVDLSVADVAWLRRQIGAVLQENVLFNRSIRDNIALADPGMPMERVMTAAEPVPMSSSWSCQMAITRWSASAARACRADSASASRSRGRW
jgi:hypothetical protein